LTHQEIVHIWGILTQPGARSVHVGLGVAVVPKSSSTVMSYCYRSWYRKETHFSAPFMTCIFDKFRWVQWCSRS